MPLIFLGAFQNLTDEKVAELAELLRVPAAVLAPVEPEPPPGEEEVGRRRESVGVAFDRAPGLAQELIRETWPRAAWEHAALIGECESNWNPSAHNTAGEDSRGWFQINIGPGANTDLADLNLFDPVENVQAALIVWKRQGWRAWLNCARVKGVPLTGGGVA